MLLLTVLNYVLIGMLIFMLWMIVIDAFIIGPIDRRFAAHKTTFEIAFIRRDEEQMVRALRNMRITCNQQRIAILISVHPIMIYRWLRGEWPPMQPGPEEQFPFRIFPNDLDIR